MKKKNKLLFLTLGAGSLISSTMIVNSCSVKTPENKNTFTKFSNSAIEDSKNLDSIVTMLNNDKDNLPGNFKYRNVFKYELLFYKKASSDSKNNVHFSVILKNYPESYTQEAYKITLSIKYSQNSKQSKYDIKNWKITNSSLENIYSWDLFKTEAVDERNVISMMRPAIVQELSNIKSAEAIDLLQPTFHFDNVINDTNHSLIAKIGFLNSKKTISLQIEQSNRNRYSVNLWAPYQDLNFSNWDLTDNSLYSFLNQASQENVFNILENAKNDKSSPIFKVNFDKNNIIKIKDVKKDFANSSFVYNVFVFVKDAKNQLKFEFSCNISLQFNIYNILKYNIKQWKISDFKLFKTTDNDKQKTSFVNWSKRFKNQTTLAKESFLTKAVNYELGSLFPIGKKDYLFLKLLENDDLRLNLKYQLVDETTNRKFIINVTNEITGLNAEVTELYLNSEIGVNYEL